MKEILTIREASEQTGISRRVLRELVASGHLRGFVTPGGGRYYVSRYALFCELLGYPAKGTEIPGAAPPDSPANNGEPSPREWNGRAISVPRNHRGSRGANSRRTSEGQRSEVPAAPPIRPPPETSPADQFVEPPEVDAELAAYNRHAARLRGRANRGCTDSPGG